MADQNAKVTRHKNPAGTYPQPSPALWNWCSRCGCSVDDNMLSGQFFDGTEGTCLGCGTVYVASSSEDGSDWTLTEREEEDADERTSDPAVGTKVETSS